MELATGGVLAERIVPTTRVDADGCAATIAALAGGLGALHAAGIIHRDVKPANLLVIGEPEVDAASTSVRRGLLVPGERIVVGDLGLAKDQDRTAAGPTIVGGTPFFRAPEQTRRGADDRSRRRRLRRDRRHLEPAHRRACRRRAPTSSAQLATVPAGVARVLQQRARRRTRRTIPDDGRVGSGRARGDRRGNRESAARLPRRGAGRHVSVQGPHVVSARGCSVLLRTRSVGRRARRAAAVVAHARHRRSVGKREVVVATRRAAARDRRGRVAGQPALAVLLFSPGPDPLDELAHQLGRLDTRRRRVSADDLRADARVRAVSLTPFSHGAARHRPVRGALHARHEPARPRRVPRRARRAHHGAGRAGPRGASRCGPTSTRRAPLIRGSPIASVTTRCSSGPCSGTSCGVPSKGPPQRAGLRLEPGLTDAFLDEAGDEPGSAPLVAHALMETWLRRRGTAARRSTGSTPPAASSVPSRSRPRTRTTGSTTTERVAARRLFLRLVVARRRRARHPAPAHLGRVRRRRRDARGHRHPRRPSAC